MSGEAPGAAAPRTSGSTLLDVLEEQAGGFYEFLKQRLEAFAVFVLTGQRHRSGAGRLRGAAGGGGDS